MLFEKNGDQPVAPASLAKLMTLEFVFNEIKQGRVKLDDEFIISENAWRKGGAPSHGSTMFAAIHSRVKVSTTSSRASSSIPPTMPASRSPKGSPATRPRSAPMLTKRAREIGLENSTFTNATGFPDPNLRVTVRDLAQLARHIMQTYPDFYPYFAERDFTWNKIRQQNRNPLLGMDIGADGLKTGDTAEAGFNLVGSAVQDDLRLIVVVTGAKSDKERADEAKKLLDFGFHGFEARVLFAEGQTVGDAKVFGGDQQLCAAGRARGTHPGDDAAQRQRAAARAGSSIPARCRRRSPRASRSASSKSGAATTWRSKCRCPPPRRRHGHHVPARHGRRHRTDDRPVARPA